MKNKKFPIFSISLMISLVVILSGCDGTFTGAAVGNSCSSNADCDTGAGEFCDLGTGTCQLSQQCNLDQCTANPGECCSGQTFADNTCPTNMRCDSGQQCVPEGVCTDAPGQCCSGQGNPDSTNCPDPSFPIKCQPGQQCQGGDACVPDVSQCCNNGYPDDTCGVGNYRCYPECQGGDACVPDVSQCCNNGYPDDTCGVGNYRCNSGCQSDQDCPQGQVCDQGQCISPGAIIICTALGDTCNCVNLPSSICIDESSESAPQGSGICEGDDIFCRLIKKLPDLGNACDSCLSEYNPDQLNTDVQNGGDVCDICPYDPSDSCPTGGTDGTSIDFLGGKIVSPNGDIIITIPPGAIPEGTDISISIEEIPGPYDDKIIDGIIYHVVKRYHILPSGTIFNDSISLIFSVDGTEFTADQQNGIELIVDGTNQKITKDLDLTNPAGIKILGITTHFTVFEAIVPFDVIADDDNDGVVNEQDNCWFVQNPGQEDIDLNCPAQPYLVDPECGDACLPCTDADEDGYSVEGGNCGPADCDDTDFNVNPEASEICDGIDNNCNNEIDEGVTIVFYADIDGDGYGNLANAVEACTIPEGDVTNNADCDDTDPEINPVVTEVCDGIDNNCDGNIDFATSLGDLDNSCGADSCEGTDVHFDYYCSEGQGCAVDQLTQDTDNDGYNGLCTDCNDNAADINSGQQELCPDDGIDNNCDGVSDFDCNAICDADNDGWWDDSIWYCAGGNDCDDGNAAINPDAEELCDSVDNNCDDDSGFWIVLGVTTADYDNNPSTGVDNRDADNDAVNDCSGDDKCFNTLAPEGVPTLGLDPNHYADVDGDTIFETNTGSKNNPVIGDSSYLLSGVYGCSCEQILSCKPGEDAGEYKYGCSAGTMNIWTSQIGWAPDCQGLTPLGKLVVRAGEAQDTVDNDQDGTSDSSDTDDDDDGILDAEDTQKKDKNNAGKPDWWCAKHLGKC